MSSTYIECSITFNESALVNKITCNTDTISIYAACAQISVGVCRCSLLAIDLGSRVSARVGGSSMTVKCE